MTNKPLDFVATKRLRDIAEETTERNRELENALYQILDSKSLDYAKEIAADILGEDLEIYSELELDLDSDFKTFGEIEDWHDNDDN